MKAFNTTAVCVPSKHYMVDLSERVKAIKQMVDAGKYFTINRARQYGKTTTIIALGFALSDSMMSSASIFRMLRLPILKMKMSLPGDWRSCCVIPETI